MEKQFSNMRLKAILKIIIPLLVIPLIVLVVMREDLETAEIVIVGCTWGIVALIYIVSGILTLRDGPKQAMTYIKSYPGGSDALDAELAEAEEFGGLKIGREHAFVDASDGFHILPLDKIEKVYVRHHGENRVKGRPGYYYLYISATLPDWSETIKVYYVSGDEARDTEVYLRQRCDLQSEE